MVPVCFPSTMMGSQEESLVERETLELVTEHPGSQSWARPSLALRP